MGKKITNGEKNQNLAENPQKRRVGKCLKEVLRLLRGETIGPEGHVVAKWEIFPNFDSK